ncbi:hypothetical protein H103_02527 [Trichophyton rubrum CBS 288.86]|uniref:Uncharacterized protein n=2 Tax=Trichophyton TaxID=5550 RepID=A0A022W9P5_TRIRU|nr:hypothetical protein H100_02520 [Trichophyton rubrum MR850]EZF54803.1 hypothetical protein H103_02527 [Trichophyton rubrum CBS 288.86]EZF65368.1 hypothetical protein H104_02505 [Trichophyton rubrum CBS 289.86]EZF76045.1 hypothetical protein H105_02532 [Trichophyton soudanense CBS 452.61]
MDLGLQLLRLIRRTNACAGLVTPPLETLALPWTDEIIMIIPMLVGPWQLEGSPTRPSLFLAPSFMIRMASCILGRSGGGDLPAVIGWTAGAVNPRPLRHSASTHRKRAVEGRSSAFFGCWALAGRAGWRDFFSLLFAFAICPLASSSPPMAASHGFSWLLMPLPLLRLVAREPVLILRHFLTPYQGSPPAINHFQPSPLRRRQQRRADQDEPSRGPTLRTHIDRRWLQNYKAHGF